MKYFLIVFLSLSVFANKEEVAEILKSINLMQSQVDAMKSVLTNQSHKDSLQAIHDATVSNMLSEAYGMRKDFLFNKAKDDGKCISSMKARLDSYQISYGANDTCSQLKVLCEANVDCSGQSQE